MSNLAIDEWIYKELDYNISPMIEALWHQDLPEDLKEELIDMDYGLPDYEAAATDEGWVKTDDPGDREFVHPDREDTSYAESWEELCETQYINTDDYRQEVFEYWLVSDRLAGMLVNHDEKVVKELLGLGPIWCRTATGQAVYMDTVIEDIYNEVMGNK